MPTSSTKLQEILSQVDARTAELASLLPMKPEYEARLWEKFRLEWNFASNHIEGNTLTYQETELLLKFDQLPTEPHTLREVEEMKAHDVAVALVQQWAADPTRELTEADIRALNETILVRPFWKDALTPDGQSTRRLISVGEYKEHSNSVRLPNGDMFHYSAPGDVPREMGELMDWYRTEGQELHPAVTAAFLHYRFVRIHPFDDGNGRISRLLLNYHLLRKKLPPVVIKSEDKRNYLFALQKADVGDLDAFCVYVAEQLLWSLNLSIKAAAEGSDEGVEPHIKKINLFKNLSAPPGKGQKRSNDIVFDRLSDSILPLVNYCKEELAVIDDLFFEIVPHFHYKFSFSSHPTPPDDLYEAIKFFNNEENLHTIQEITWSIYWKGLKSFPDEKNNIGISVNFRLEEYLYKVEFHALQEPLLAKDYSSKIFPADRAKVAKTVVQLVTERITTNPF